MLSGIRPNRVETYCILHKDAEIPLARYDFQGGGAVLLLPRTKKGIFNKNILLRMRLKIDLTDCHTDAKYETKNPRWKSGGIRAPRQGASRVNSVRTFLFG